MSGFEAAATVTMLGLVFPEGVRVFLNTSDRSVDQTLLEGTQEQRFSTRIVLSTHSSERSTLEAFAETIEQKVSPREYLLIAYNGELWRSGFDLPFLRTRFLRQDIAWPFTDVPYADLLPLIRDRFNTKTTGSDESTASLKQTYKQLIGGELTELDPFEDSAEAVTAFGNAEFDLLLQHNIADILRTQALADVAQRYCSKSDFKLKSLTPTRM